MDCQYIKPLKIHLVSSPEFTRLTRALTHSSLIGLDAEWKPHSHQSNFRTVTLVQLACQPGPQLSSGSDELKESVVFLLDLSSTSLSSIWELLKEVFALPDVLKLGFEFKQYLIYLSSIVCSQGCEPGFERPYLDITSMYNYLNHKQLGRKLPRETKSLATICKEVLGISLAKELQCSDWSRLPLTEEQKNYVATDAHCLLEISNIFRAKVAQEVLVLSEGVISRVSRRNSMPMDESPHVVKMAKKYGERFLLTDSDKIPKASKKKWRRSIVW